MTTGEDQTHREKRLDRLLADYLRRLDAGQATDSARLLAEHADLADELQRLLRTADLVQQMAGPVVSTGPPPRAVGPDDVTATFPGEADTSGTAGSDPSAPTAAGGLPRRFGDYELLEVIGRGGMGVVYKARQVELDRLVAVKMIRDSRLASEADVRRFRIEAQAAGRLTHPNLVAIHEVGEIDGQHFYSMDYIDGTDLARVLQSGPIDARGAARYVMQMAEGIHCAHEHGILHRDLKLGNVLIDRDGTPHIADFGLAKRMGDQTSLTASGAAIGTPSYMSPEQAAGNHRKVGRASDVYSLGAILYALLTGRPPFRKETGVETMFDVMHTDPTPPQAINPNVDRDLETICLKCLEKRPGRRYATAADLAQDLDRFLHGEPIQAKPAGALTKSLRWVRHIPMVAALTGGKLLEPSAWQRRANGAIMLAAILLVVALAIGQLMPHLLPRRIRLASAAAGGAYHEFCLAYGQRLENTLGRATEVLETQGSVANAQLLLRREAQAALLQENAITSDQIAVVAPLYFEVVYVVVRKDRHIRRLADLQGRNVSLGPKGSGMRLSALRILEATERVTPDRLGRSESYFSTLSEDADLDAALITIAAGHTKVKQLLAHGDFELLALDDALIERLSMQHPWCRPYTIRRGSLQPARADSDAVPATDVPTIATVTFLAVRRDAPATLVTSMLETLYEGSDLVGRFGLLTAVEASRWREFALHPAAHEYFEARKQQ